MRAVLKKIIAEKASAKNQEMALTVIVEVVGRQPVEPFLVDFVARLGGERQKHALQRIRLLKTKWRSMVSTDAMQ